MEKKRLLIKDLTTTCEGIAKSDEAVVFVDGALPEEEVEVEILSKKKNYSSARLLKIISPSEFRVVPPCKYFGSCGGCGLQHAGKKLQLNWKTKRVLDALTRIGKVSNLVVEECKSTEQDYGYRNKITTPLLEVDGYKKIGFFKKRSHEIVSIDSCLLHMPMADVVYGQVRNILLSSDLSFYNEEKRRGDFQHLVIRSSEFENAVLIGIIGLVKPTKALRDVAKLLFAIKGVKGVVYGKKGKATNSIYPDFLEALEGDDEIVEELLGIKVRVSLLSFFQVNKPLALMLYQTAYELADIKEGERVLDAYSGIGLFAIYLAKKGAKVTAIESFGKAVEDARRNALENHVEVHCIEGNVEEKVADLRNFETIFINPPRKGVHQDVIDALYKIGPKKIIYTSCDPATLARDVALFASKGYLCKKAIPFDMFPQTIHVETIVLLVKNH